MRAELSARLIDLRTEINRINTEIHSHHGSGQTTYPYYPMPTSPPIAMPTPLPTPYPLPGPYPQPMPVPFPGTVSPYPGGIEIGGILGGIDGIDEPTIIQPWNNSTPTYGGTYGAALASLNQPVFEPSMVMRSANNPTIGTVAGLPARRLDIDEFNGSMHEIWSTSAGMVLTPAGEGVQRADQAEQAWVNPATKAVGDVAQWFGDNPKTARELFKGDEVSVGAVIEKYGTDRLDGGVTLEARLNALPSGMKLRKPNDLVNALADRAVNASNRGGVGMETLVSNIGISSGAKNVEAVGIENYRGLPVSARNSLREKGIKTVGNFTQASPEKIADILEGAGVANARSSAARWQGEAQMVTKLGASLTAKGR